MKAWRVTRKVLFAAILTGCLTGQKIQFAEYDVVLWKGERVSGGRTPVALNIQMLDRSKSTNEGRIEDDIVELDVFVKPAQIVLSVRNKGDQPIRIDWRGGVYVDEEARRHEGLSISLVSPGEASTIAPGRRSLFIGTPSDIAQQRPGVITFKNFLVPPPAPPSELPPADVAAHCAKIGHGVELILPIESGGHMYEYRLRFRIAGIVVLEQRGDVPLAKYDWGGCRD
jgi:hypothetical protein